ncbi:hypothetical protein PR202_ga05570 [Eleusine coracana subsp. coracana]|uniref:Uncharacterized protein n=1 Tax=Eleusine coracana subsp. coracana TaxID=191504 RepID=A0AAV5BTU7_ELECO|nr:hypothetical protein PR202_ga05116 [Eleusine coracana subsp. coracana]GJM89381.1 hypothetical protein PR202_ga05570 [Eleusine coracana subsp. coracana]
MASDSSKPSKKLRILLVPFLAASHIGPFTDLAFHLAAARPGAVEATVAVTHANASVVRSALARRDPNTCADDVAAVHVATYAFPAAAGLPPGVENLSTGHRRGRVAHRRVRHRRGADAAGAGAPRQGSLPGRRRHRRALLLERRRGREPRRAVRHVPRPSARSRRRPCSSSCSAACTASPMTR